MPLLKSDECVSCCVVASTSGGKQGEAVACRRRLLTPRHVRRSCACTATVTATCGAVTSTAASASGARPAARCAAPCSGPARATSGVVVGRLHVCRSICALSMSMSRPAAGRILIQHTSRVRRALASDGSGHTYVGGSSGNVKALRLRFTGARNNCCVEHAGTLRLRVSRSSYWDAIVCD